MSKFPDAVISAMHHTRTTVTCLPVQLDGGEWESAIFFVLPETYNEDSLKQIFARQSLLPVGLEADLLEQDSATLIALSINIDLDDGSPLQGEILFLTGHLDTHFETVQSLSAQEGITLFIGDCFCNLVHQQVIPLGPEHREVLGQLLKEASSRDALIRFRGQYDPEAAFRQLTAHFESTQPTIN